MQKGLGVGPKLQLPMFPTRVPAYELPGHLAPIKCSNKVLQIANYVQLRVGSLSFRMAEMIAVARMILTSFFAYLVW